MRRIIALIAVVAALWPAALGLGTSIVQAATPGARATTHDDTRPDAVEAMGIRSAKATGVAVRSSDITYHNGPVMTGTVNVYYVWYGDWSANTSGQAILTDFAGSLGGSPYYKVNTTYTNAAKVAVSGSLAFSGSMIDAYSQGKTLTDATVRTVVSSAITSGRLPKDANGVYVVLSSPDVKESSGFVTKYCGWHTHATIASTDIKYSFVGDPTTQGLGSCAVQTGTSPNANPGADAMVSVLAHEIEEAVTDPDLNAWYDRSGAENADKCAWTFGTTYKVSNGSLANMRLGARDYLVQQNWKAGATQGCALSQ